MRILFITGLGEDEFIFDRIKDRLPGEKLVLSLWKELPERHMPGINVQEFAQSLIGRYHIGPGDLVIGHSTGGWVALFLKQATGCTIIQLASWTDPKKIVTPVTNRRLIYFAARTGLYLNRFFLRYALRFYRGKPSRDVFRQIFLRLITGNRANAVNQLRTIFNPVAGPVTVMPDLRIHARADRVIRYPDGPVTEVPGDHFSLFTYPDEVVAAIGDFLLKSGTPSTIPSSKPGGTGG